MDISPDKQNIDRVFSNTTYHIDFYQRDYKWTSEPVERLLDDIFFKFNEEYEKFKSLEPSPETITKYPWYYLNTYVTNTIEGKVYVVDGQQRLTTLTLILIALNKTAKSHKSKLQKWIENKIAGQSGYGAKFWMNHEKHVTTLEGLFEAKKELEEIDTSSGITAVNMVNNFKIIETWLNSRLSDQNKFETFVFYFLYRLVLINLAVEQTDVPMVFEVINDRGVRLKPYEILKGKLLGQIDKLELDKSYNGLWEKQVNAINSFDFKEDEIDSFFRYYLKGNYANTRKDGTRFDGEYQREVFSNEMDKVLKLKHNPKNVKDFLDNPFSFYTNLYLKLLKAYSNDSKKHHYVYLNRLNEMNSQFMLILSGIKLYDPEEEAKINALAYELDRLFSLLQLQNAYDSNTFNDTIYLILSEIRDQPLNTIRPVFDKHLLKVLAEKRNTQVDTPFQYSFFKNIGISLNPRFKRYFFARVEEFLSDNMSLNLKHSLSDLVSKTGHKTGFHIEHILSYNEENLNLFNNDKDLFEQERNRLGGILLLKGKDNISSNNEPYTDKLKSYANTLYWNETLREDTYKSKLDMRDLNEKFNLNPLNQFGPDELEQRHKILFEIAKVIWE